MASCLFYAAWNPPFVALLWVSTVVDWIAAQKLVRAQGQASRRAWMLLSVLVNLGMLGYFKYGSFLLTNFAAAVHAVGLQYQPAAMDIVLPVGISFYTFATMSYTLDVYLRRAAPAKNFLDYALFVTFSRICERPCRATVDQLRFGLALMTLGLFQKAVLADSFLGKPAELVFDGRTAPSALDAWIGTLAFSGAGRGEGLRCVPGPLRPASPPSV